MKEITIPQGMRSTVTIDEKDIRGLQGAILDSQLPPPVIGKIDAILSAIATERLVDSYDHVSLKGLRDAVKELARGKVALKYR